MSADLFTTDFSQEDTAITEVLNQFENLFIAKRSKTTVTQINQQDDTEINEAEESPLSYANKVVRIAMTTAQSDDEVRHIMASWAPKYLSWYVVWRFGYDEAMKAVLGRMNEIGEHITREFPASISKLALQRRLTTAFEGMAPKYRIMVREETKIGLLEFYVHVIKEHGVACYDEKNEGSENNKSGL